jgi:cellulose synthase/poly-beta-1,6-N-acetylglucosamine synthase-like glycosyltransferase
MLDLIFIPLLLLYFSVLTLLFIYGANFLHLTWTALRSANATPPAIVPGVWPRVCVQLPIYNEMYVSRRLIDATAALDYPASRIEIQVLDDSTDETSQIVAQAVEVWRRRGVDITHVRRGSRQGFKAGALAYGMEHTDAEYIAIFDADFIPEPDFLRRTVPVLYADEGLSFVQTRWGHTNRSHSLLTFLQSLSIDGHFAVEQYSRWKLGYFFNFNGTAGVWRRAAMIDAGGWHDETLTEDLDLSVRAFMRGWRAAYVRDIQSPAELPVGFDAFRRQQHRWARGSFECAYKYVPTIWRSPLSWWQKVQTTLRLTGYAIHLLMLALCLLYPLLVLVATQYPALLSLFGFMAVFNFAGIAPSIMFGVGQQQLRRPGWKRLLVAVPLLSFLGAGMMVTTARAFWQSLSPRRQAFERTPKFGLSGQKREWRRMRYQLPLDRIVVAEYLLAALNFATCMAAFRHEAWAVSVYTALFGTGLAATATFAILQSIRARRGERESAPVIADIPEFVSGGGGS